MKKLFFVLIFLILVSGCVQQPESFCGDGFCGEGENKGNCPGDCIDLSVSWESMNGPPGGHVMELVQNPVPPHELYTATHTGVYKSQDKGESWQLMEELEDLKTIPSLTSDKFNWDEIAPTGSELSDLKPPPKDVGFVHYVKTEEVVSVGNRILANIVLHVDGSGEFTNGGLYVSEDSGKSWSMVDLGLPEGVIVSNIIQNPKDPEHIVLACKHTVVHEKLSPLSELLRESRDGGKTWSRLTDLTLQTNGVEDVVISGNAYYLLNPYGWGIIRLEGSDYEQIETPRIKEFWGMDFNLDRLMFDYENPDIAYGKTGSIWALGIVKSEDGMKTWKKMDRDIVASSPTIVLTHPEDPDVVMTSGNVIQESYLTRDFGKTWEPFTPVSAGDDVKIDPHDTEHILMVDEMTEIYESNDTGRTFQRIARYFSSAKVFDFEVTGDDSEKIYVSNIGVGISGGTKGSWQYLTNSPDYAYDIEIDPGDSNILYATYSPKIFENHSSIWRYSKNQKENSGWSEILKVEDSGGITSLRFDPSNTDRIYAGVIGDMGGIYVSGDKGKTWDVLNDKFIMSTVWGQPQLVVDPDDPNVVYAATWLGGTWKTTDSGVTWTLLGDAPVSSTALGLDRQNTGTIYLADRSSPTVWKSADGGGTWEQVADFSKDGALLVMRVFADGDNVYASTFMPSLRGGRLYKSTDEGGTWEDITGTLPKGILDIEADWSNPDVVYVTTNINGAFRSADGGKTWSEMGLPYVGAYDVEVDQNDPTILYAAARGGSLPGWFTVIAGYPDGITFDDSAGVYKSSDSGQTWSKLLETSVSCRAVRRHPDNPDLLFAPDLADGFQVSADGGETWTKYNEGLDKCVPTSVAVNGDKVYVGTQGCGVYSGDLDIGTGRITWKPGRSNKPVPEVYNLQIEIDPTDPDKIFVGSNPGGLYASTNGGVTFRDRNAITPSVIVDDPLLQGYYTFAIDPTDPSRMWIGTWGKGIYKSYNAMILDVPAGLFGKHIRKVVIDPSNPDDVYVATKEGVFVTRDEGNTWDEMNQGLETLDILSLKVTSVEYEPFEDDFEDGNLDGWDVVKHEGWSLAEEDSNYFLQGIGHKWANAELGSWTDYTFETRVKLIQGGVHINFRKSDEGRYFLGFNDGGLYLSKQFNKWSEFADLARNEESYNLGQWYDFRIELDGGNIKVYVDGGLKIDHTDPEPLTEGVVAFETLDDSQVHVDDIHVRRKDPIDYAIYAGTAGYGLYKYNSLNREWKNLGDTFGGGWWSPWERRMYQFSSILFDPDVPGKVYYGHFPSGFFISEDNGHTWKDSSLGLGNDGMFSLSMHPYNHNILFAGTYNGVSKSTDGGRTWVMKSNGMPSEQWPYTLAIDSDNPNIMYASTKNGQNKGLCHRNQHTFCGVVMKSTDGGESWFEIMNGLQPLSEFYTLIIHPDNHDILFMSTNMGVYMSRDAGNSWKDINSNLPSKHNQVRDNVADNLALTADNKYLILGLMDHGAWKADLSKIDLGS